MRTSLTSAIVLTCLISELVHGTEPTPFRNRRIVCGELSFYAIVTQALGGMKEANAQVDIQMVESYDDQAAPSPAMDDVLRIVLNSGEVVYSRLPDQHVRLRTGDQLKGAIRLEHEPRLFTIDSLHSGENALIVADTRPTNAPVVMHDYPAVRAFRSSGEELFRIPLDSIYREVDLNSLDTFYGEVQWINALWIDSTGTSLVIVAEKQKRAHYQTVNIKTFESHAAGVEVLHDALRDGSELAMLAALEVAELHGGKPEREIIQSRLNASGNSLRLEIMSIDTLAAMGHPVSEHVVVNVLQIFVQSESSNQPAVDVTTARTAIRLIAHYKPKQGGSWLRLLRSSERFSRLKSEIDDAASRLQLPE